MFVEAAGELSSQSRTSFPSAVSRSADGQILVLTHSFLHILTPGLGLSVRADRSVLSGYPGNKLQDQWSTDEAREAFESGECSGLTIFKTSIAAQRRSTDWEEYTTDSRLTAPGALDNGWRMASWSPSGLSKGGWCLLATLNVNGEVVVYGSGSDAVKAVWQEVFDLTSTYIDQILDEPFQPYYADPTTPADDQKAKRDAFTMKAQCTSVAWSSAGPDHAVSDQSLLAVGHKSGHVTFWRYTSPTSMTMMAEIKALDQWPSVMAWSAWGSILHSDAQHATLAIAGASGGVQLLGVSISVDGAVTCTLEQAISPSPKAATMLQWQDDGKLVIGRLNEISTWKREESGQFVFVVPIEDFRGWTSMANPIDCVELPATDSLIVAMTDGTIRLIGQAENAGPAQLSSLQDPKSAEEGSLALCESLRTSFMALEKASNKSKQRTPVPATAAMRLSAFSQLDSIGTIFLAYEKHQLDRRIYVMANLRKLSFAIARYDNAIIDRQVIQATKAALEEVAESGCSQSSHKTLFPILLALRHLYSRKEFLEALHDLILRSTPHNYSPVIPYQSEESQFRFLLGDPKLQALRLGSLLLRDLSLHAKSEETQVACARSYRKMSLSIYLLVFRALQSMVNTFATGDSLLQVRYNKVVEALETAAGNNTMDLVGHDEEEEVVEKFKTTLDEEDRCAACHEVIPFDQLGKATCRNGHAWIRCSVTLAVMFSAAARTCTVCNRKSQLPKSLGTDEDAAAQATQKLLRAAKYCLFCGGRWNGGV